MRQLADDTSHSIGLGIIAVSVLLMIIRTHVAAMIVFLAFAGVGLSASLTPILQDLASVVHTIPGLSSGHVYSTFNGAFSLGAFVGPIIVGQLFGALVLATHPPTKPCELTSACRWTGRHLGLDSVVHLPRRLQRRPLPFRSVLRWRQEGAARGEAPHGVPQERGGRRGLGQRGRAGREGSGGRRDGAGA